MAFNPSPKLLFHLSLTNQPQTGTYQAIAAQSELLGDDPFLVDMVRDDFYVAHQRGKLVSKYTDLKLNEVRQGGGCAVKGLKREGGKRRNEEREGVA